MHSLVMLGRSIEGVQKKQSPENTLSRGYLRIDDSVLQLETALAVACCSIHENSDGWTVVRNIDRLILVHVGS